MVTFEARFLLGFSGEPIRSIVDIPESTNYEANGELAPSSSYSFTKNCTEL